MKSLDWLLELFNWKIKEFLSVGYLRLLFLMWLLTTAILLGGVEYFIGNSDQYGLSVKLILGLLAIVIAVVTNLLIRVAIEFQIAVFYIEGHLRKIESKQSSTPQ